MIFGRSDQVLIAPLKTRCYPSSSCGVSRKGVVATKDEGRGAEFEILRSNTASFEGVKHGSV